MNEPLIRQAVHARIGGATPASAGDWFVARLNGRTFERGLSIGCGVGNLEREAIRRNVCASIDAFDASLGSLLAARRAADEEGFSDRIRYFASDFNRPALPRDTYDIVFANQSLHHVGKLEKLFRALLRAMKPGAVLYLDEYIGPSRTDWNDDVIAPHRAAFAALPAAARTSAVLPLPIQADDPSEAVRSSEILPQLAIGFDFEEVRDYGGNLLAVLYPLIDWSRVPDEAKARLIAEDGEWAKQGSYHAVVVGRPVTGPRRLYASARWCLEPKAKRALFEVRRRLASTSPGPAPRSRRAG
ncbi:MAG TPA: class I SAM-dependent methyltransferase [Thermoanaerobaculia bacterium]|nr:class I SAM-dependent methyltransferase [Thermoanaerobaculia bacterium]